MKINVSKTTINRIILALTAIVYNGIYLQLSTFTNTDEFSSLAVPAILSGKDWSSIASLSSFHGFGYTILLTPLFWFIDNGALLYRFAMLGMLILRILMVEMTYSIISKFWGIAKNNALFLSIICNIGTMAPEVQSPLSVMSEVPFCIMIVLIVYLWIKVLYNPDKYIYYGGIAIASAYLAIIHSRALIFYVSMGIVLIISIIFDYRQKGVLKRIAIIVTTFAVVYLLLNLLTNFINELVYLDNESISGTFSTVMSTKTKSVFALFANKDRFKVAMEMFLSLLASFSYYSFGIISFVCCAIVAYVIKFFKGEISRNREEKSILYMSILGMTSWIGMNLGIAISSYGSYLDKNYRWYTYVRYAMPFTWLMMMAGIVIMYRNSDLIRKILFPSAIGNILLYKYFLLVTANLLDESGYNLSYSIFNSFNIWGAKEATTYFSKYTLICIVCSCVYVLLLKKNYVNRTLIIYGVLSVVVYTQVYSYSMNRNIQFDDICDKSAKYIQNNKEIGDEKNPIGIMGSKRYCYFLQLKCPDKKFEYIDQIDDFYEIILFDQMPDEVIEKNNYIQLDENEYLIFNNMNHIKDKVN